MRLNNQLFSVLLYISANHLWAPTQGGVISASMVKCDYVIRNRTVPGERPIAVCPTTHGGCECNFYPSCDRDKPTRKEKKHSYVRYLFYRGQKSLTSRYHKLFWSFWPQHWAFLRTSLARLKTPKSLHTSKICLTGQIGLLLYPKTAFYRNHWLIRLGTLSCIAR